MNLIIGFLATTTVLSSLSTVKTANEVTYNHNKYEENLALIQKTDLSNLDYNDLNGKLKVEIYDYFKENSLNEKNFNSLKTYLFKNDSNFKSGARSIKRDLSFTYDSGQIVSSSSNYKFEKTNNPSSFNGIQVVKEYKSNPFYGFYIDKETCTFVFNVLVDIVSKTKDFLELYNAINLAYNLALESYLATISTKIALFLSKIILAIGDIVIKVCIAILCAVVFAAAIIFAIISYIGARNKGLLIGFKKENTKWLPYLEII